MTYCSKYGGVLCFHPVVLNWHSANMTTKTIGSGEYRLSSDYLILLGELAFERGIPMSVLLAETGLPENLMLMPGVQIGHESALQLVDNFLQETDIATALEFGKRMTLSKHGALGYAAQYSQTMEDAAGKVIQFIETRVQLFELRRESDPTTRNLYIASRIPDSRAGLFMTLAFLASVETICRTLVTGEARKAESTLQIAVEGDLSNQETLPCCTVQTSAKLNCLTWPRNALDGMLPFFDPKLADLAQQELTQALTHVTETNTMAGKVREILNEHLAEMPTVEDVANMLFMSAATLNRKLKAEQRSFQQIKDELRYSKAQRLLKETTLSVDQIADQLGYSDASNFAKAFKNWSSFSPSQYRQGSTD